MKSIIILMLLLFSSILNADISRAEILDRNNVVLAYSNVDSKRFYPFGLETAHILGYSRLNSSTRVGLEKQYNDMLLKGISLKTTIDIKLQKYLYKIFNNLSGIAIVMNANNGEILAAGSFPSYDSNIFIYGMKKEKYFNLLNNRKKPFTDRLINALYPSGSTIKTGLGLHYISTDIDANENGHGKTDIQKAIRENCDDYFYKGSLQVGIKKMSDALHRYGFGQQTGVDLPNEFKGLVPSPKWKKEKYNKPWYIGETLNTSIGQGSFLVTPMQIAKFTALMATGKSVTPHFNKSLNPLVKDVLNKNEFTNLPLIQNAMYEVCNHPKGTATKYLSSSIEIAGQIGQSQVIGSKNKELNRSHAWLTTYGPYKNPKYVVTVLIEHSSNDGALTGKIVSKIYNKLLELDYVK